MVGTPGSVAAAIREWWRLVMDEPAAMLVVIILFVVSVFGAAWTIDHFYERQSDFNQKMTSVYKKIDSIDANLGKNLGQKLDNISCEVQWNRYTTQMQNYRVQERALTQQIQTQRRYLDHLGKRATEHDRAIYDALKSQRTYVQREESSLPKPPCPFPFQE